MNTKTAKLIYLIGLISSGVVGIAALVGGISSDTADSLNQILLGLGALLGTGAATTAGVRVIKQTKPGGALTHSPLEQVTNNIPIIVARAQQATADLDTVRQVTSEALGALPGALGVPVLGPLAEQAINIVKATDR